MWYNFHLMRTTLQAAFAYCLISTVACAAVAPYAKFEDGMLSMTRPALARYFLLYSKKHVSECRNVVNAEGILWAYSHTGDKKLLELAEEAWRMRKPMPPEKKNELAPQNCANNDAIHMHGVSYCEEMKVPVLRLGVFPDVSKMP